MMLYRIALFTFALSLGFGCVRADEPDRGTSEESSEALDASKTDASEETAECTADWECPWGESCTNGTCRPMPSDSESYSECTINTECAGHQTCSEGFCITAPSPTQAEGGCQRHADCTDEGEICINGVCRVDPWADNTTTSEEDVDEKPPEGLYGGCYGDEDCQNGGVCSEGACVPPPTSEGPTDDGSCNANWDCDWGEVCIDDACVTPESGGNCETNWNCPFGETCIYGICSTPESGGGCDDLFDCPFGDVCTQGICSTPEDECECPPGE